MRLMHFDLSRYGNFESVSLELDPAPGRINLVVAPNGAGKSVIRQAFGDLLFGIDVQTRMDFGLGYEGMRLSATVADASGPVAFTRRKGRSRTLLDAAGQPFDEALFHRWLGSADRALLDRLFTLDTAQLRRAETELKATHGAFASALLAGTGELRPAQDVQRALRERRDSIWTKGRSSLPLNKAVRGWEEARRALRDSVLAPPHRAAQERRLQECEATRKSADESYAAARRDHARLSRTLATRPLLDQYDRASAWLRDNADAPVLPDNLSERLSTARGDLTLAASALADARTAHGQAAAQARDIVIDEPILAHAESIARLQEQRSVNRTAADDLVKRRREHRAALAEAARLLEELGLDIPPDRAAEILPKAADIATGRDLIKDHAVRKTACETTAHANATAHDKLQELTAIDQAPDAASLPPGLAEFVAEIRADGDPARRARDAAAEVQHAKATEAARLAMVPGWTQDADALRRLAPAGIAAYERLDAARGQAEADLRTAADEHLRQVKAQTDRQAELDALVAERPLQDPDALPAARRRRDAGWQLIHRRAFGVVPSAVEEDAFRAGIEMPLAFERAMHEADRLADERAADSSRLAQAERLWHEKAHAMLPIEAAQAAASEAQRRAETARMAWAADCASLGLAADAAIGDVREFLAHRADAVEAARHADITRATQTELTRRHDGWANRLAAITCAPAASLPALLAHVDRLAAAAQEARRARDTLQGELRSAQAAARKAERDSVAAEAAMTDWRGAWKLALAALGRPADEPPATTERLLSALADLRQAVRDAAASMERIDAMETSIAAFTAEAETLCGLLGLQRPADSFEAARALAQRAAAAGRHASGREEANRALATRDETLQLKTEAERVAQAELSAVVAEAGADSAEAAERRIGLARERRLHEAARAKAEAGLAEAGGSQTLSMLRTEAQSADPAHTRHLLDLADVAMAQAKSAAESAAIDLSQMQAEIARDSDATDARDNAAALAEAEATLRRTLDDALLLQLAAAQMEQAMARVEEGSDDDNLARLGASFARLTEGAYAGLAIGEEKGVTVLHALDAATRQRRTVDQLSEGTRDQLYLALRLVAIAEHAAHAPPLPFIGDDILQTFDDGRARATFHALLDLSHSVQVIVLTHHPHLAALATGMPINVQQLPAFVGHA